MRVPTFRVGFAEGGASSSLTSFSSLISLLLLLLLLCRLTSSLHSSFARWLATYNLFFSLALCSFWMRRETMLTSPLPNLTSAAPVSFSSTAQRVTSSGKHPKRRRSWSTVPTNSNLSDRRIMQMHLIQNPCVSNEQRFNCSSPSQSSYSNLNHQSPFAMIKYRNARESLICGPATASGVCVQGRSLEQNIFDSSCQWSALPFYTLR
jgi:hypothetical protein